MSVGFRKSLFGFNTDDVINYIKKLHNNFTEKEAVFKAQISALEEKINTLSNEQSRLENEKQALNLKLEEYDAKSAEMERLSENIGKLYLVAQTNAKSIMDNAEESAVLANEQVSRNVATIEEAHIALQELQRSITATGESFTREIGKLMSALDETKQKLAEDTKENSDASTEFAQLLEAVSK